MRGLRIKDWSVTNEFSNHTSYCSKLFYSWICTQLSIESIRPLGFKLGLELRLDNTMWQRELDFRILPKKYSLLDTHLIHFGLGSQTIYLLVIQCFQLRCRSCNMHHTPQNTFLNPLYNYAHNYKLIPGLRLEKYSTHVVEHITWQIFSPEFENF